MFICTPILIFICNPKGFISVSQQDTRTSRLPSLFKKEADPSEKNGCQNLEHSIFDTEEILTQSVGVILLVMIYRAELPHIEALRVIVKQ